MKKTNRKISASTLARTAALALALTNQLLSTGLTMAAALVSWWENNSFTPEAIEADGYLNQLKQK